MTSSSRPSWWDDPPDSFSANPILVEAWRAINLVDWNYPTATDNYRFDLKYTIAESYLPNQLVYQFCVKQILG